MANNSSGGGGDNNNSNLNNDKQKEQQANILETQQQKISDLQVKFFFYVLTFELMYSLIVWITFFIL